MDLMSLPNSFSRWCCQCSLNCPSRIEAVKQALGKQSIPTSPFSRMQRFSVERQHSIVSSIGRLNGRSAPSNVILLVVSVHVDTVDGEFWSWTTSDISKKCVKGIYPFWINLDTAAAVQVVPLRIRVEASSLHGSPDTVFGRLDAIHEFSVLRRGTRRGIRAFSRAECSFQAQLRVLGWLVERFTAQVANIGTLLTHREIPARGVWSRAVSAAPGHLVIVPYDTLSGLSVGLGG